MVDLFGQVLREVLNSDKDLLMHGGQSVITKFDPSKIQGGSRATLGYGVYFSDSIHKAKDYGPVLTYLDPSKLNILDTRDDVTDKFVQSIKALAGKQTDSFSSALYGVYANKLKSQEGRSIDDAVKNMFSEFKHAQEKNWASMLIDLGYDATKNGYEYVIFNFEKADQALVNK